MDEFVGQTRTSSVWIKLWTLTKTEDFIFGLEATRNPLIGRHRPTEPEVLSEDLLLSCFAGIVREGIMNY